MEGQTGRKDAGARDAEGPMDVCVFGLRGFPLVEGGVERHCESLYPRMDEGLAFTVFRRRPYVRSHRGYPHIRFVDLPSTRFKGVEAVLHSFLATREVARARPAVAHIHNIGPALFSPMLKRQGIPIVLTYHSPNYEHGKWGRFARKLLRLSERIALANASRIIFVNRFQMEKFPEEIRRKSVYIPNGIEPPAAPSGRNELDALGVEPGRYVLAVGRITPEKGFDTLIRGFRASKHGGCKLVIAGGVETEGGYMEKLRRLAGGGGDVAFAGQVFGDKLAQLYANAALYVLSSNNEGFPLVLLEAMSYGLPVLASDIPASHLVSLDADDYFPRGNAKALAGKISERLANPKKPAYDLAGHDWKTIAARTTAVYREAVEAKGNGENPA